MSIIGLDVGTSQVKAVRFDEAWQVASIATERTSVLRPQAGWSEQDPHEVWRAAGRVISKVAGPDVDLLAVTAQGDGCWLVDSAGDPARAALLWNDSRASSYIEAWERDGTLEAAFRVTGCYGAAGLAHAQLRWLADNEPAVIERASTLLSCGSWIFFRLTGERVLHVSDAGNPFLDATAASYDHALLDRYGLGDLRRLLPPVLEGPDTIASLTEAAAVELGLGARTPVALAPYDVLAAALGVGAVRPGQASVILGTTMCVGTVADQPRLDRPLNGMTLLTGHPGRWLIAYATLAGTEVLDWTAELLGLSAAADVVALAEKSSRTDLPLLLPYLSPAGERAPFLDPTARGVLAGLTLRHTQADVARATLIGLTLAVRDCLTAAGPATALAASGGGARSDIWCQAISDATGLDVLRPDTPETGARGAALAGAVSLGRFAGVDEAVDAVVRPGLVHQPDESRRAAFDDAFERFLQARRLGALHL
jgi:erythritol kinase (D-erythritol 1-phosphate-forming)